MGGVNRDELSPFCREFGDPSDLLRVFDDYMKVQHDEEANEVPDEEEEDTEEDEGREQVDMGRLKSLIDIALEREGNSDEDVVDVTEACTCADAELDVESPGSV